MINQLKLFGLITKKRKGDQSFYIAPRGNSRLDYIDYTSNSSSKNFVRTSFKLKIFQDHLQYDELRNLAYQSVHAG